MCFGVKLRQEVYLRTKDASNDKEEKSLGGIKMDAGRDRFILLLHFAPLTPAKGIEQQLSWRVGSLLK
jgi:hypothetical protein